ncbi:MAG: hypothetical protein FWD87_08540 [Spirochaetaceae bacterium]|nr:hypothetical protein [Spirochaetaceae bacterium]
MGDGRIIPTNHIAEYMQFVNYPGESSSTITVMIKACTGRAASIYDTDNFTARNQEEATCHECKKLSDEFLQYFKKQSRGCLLKCAAYRKAFAQGDVEEAIRIYKDAWETYYDGKM